LRQRVEVGHPHLSIARQCELLGLSRSGYYYQPTGESELNLLLMRLIDAEYTEHPFFGYRKMVHILRAEGHLVNKKRIARLMHLMGLQAMVPGPNTSRPHPENPVYPYRLRGVKIERVNQVWSCDITYIPMPKGFMYLFAIIDWDSRFVLAWQLSNTLDTAFCIEGLDQALAGGKPTIFNSDQGSQFTSQEFTGRLLSAGITISMDGRGRALDNIFVERLWRTVKYENIYMKGYETPKEVYSGLCDYFPFYNEARPHQALAYKTPAAVYYQSLGC
jgi:putative transposase